MKNLGDNMTSIQTKEPQNQIQMDSYYRKGPVKMGPWTSHIWRTDPKHFCFLLSRYKFCAKMLAGKETVLEIGCGDAFGTLLVKQTVGTIYAIDFEPLVIEDARKRLDEEQVNNVKLSIHDITVIPLQRKFDAAYSLDVIEHIPPEKEESFMTNIIGSLKKNAVLIIGTPNVTAEKYASEFSREGHTNLKSVEALDKLMSRYFINVFNFSMNDEVVSTGFGPMAHYIFSMGVGVY